MSIVKCFRYCSIFNKPAYKMRIFGHVQNPPPPLYAFVCISVDPPTSLGAYVINGRPLPFREMIKILRHRCVYSRVIMTGNKEIQICLHFEFEVSDVCGPCRLLDFLASVSFGAFHLVRTLFYMLSGPTHPLFAPLYFTFLLLHKSLLLYVSLGFNLLYLNIRQVWRNMTLDP